MNVKTPAQLISDETRAMRQKTKLVKPSPLLLRVRSLFTDGGGDGDAFDFAVADYAAKTPVPEDGEPDADR